MKTFNEIKDLMVDGGGIETDMRIFKLLTAVQGLINQSLETLARLLSRLAMAHWHGTEIESSSHSARVSHGLVRTTDIEARGSIK